MKIINPNEIGTKISTLFLEAKSKIIIVSPYIKISEWKKMLVNLEQCQSKGIEIDCYYRDLHDRDLRVLERLEVNLYQIEGLHAKLYFNESQVIVSSMNLHEYSDNNSIDIGMLYQREEEYREVFEYFEKYIKSQREDNQEASSNFLTFFKKSPKIHLDKALYDLDILLKHNYKEVKVTLATDYIFCGNLLPIFDVMFLSDEIRFKVPNKKIKPEYVKTLANSFERINYCKAILEEPTENYGYFNFYVEYNIHDHTSLIGFLNELKADLEELRDKSNHFKNWYYV